MVAPSFTMDSKELEMLLCLILPSFRHTLSFLGITSQKAELTALATALTLAKYKTVNIYTDSKYVFHTLLAHSAIWKERGFLTTRGTPIINAALIAQILEASHLPSQVGITHCKDH
jgi:ribonuclease HI